MATIKLTGSVGNPKVRSSPKVQNNPKDVKLIRQMINANTGNHRLKMSDKVDSSMIKAIGIMNVRAKQRPPQYVIDPGDATFQYLLKKYAAQVKEQGKVDYVKFKYKGKVQWVTKPEFIRCKTGILKKLKQIAKLHRSQYRFHEKICADFDKVAMVQKGTLLAFTHMVTIKAGSVKPVNASYRDKTHFYLKQLDKALAKVQANLGSVRGNALDEVEPALKRVELQLGAFVRDTQRFLREFSGSAGTVATVLTVTSTTAFAVLTAMAAPALVAGTAITSTGTAAIAAGTGVKVMETASNELGRHLSGEKRSLGQSLWAVGVDGTVALITGGISNKLPLKLFDDAADELAKKAAKEMVGFSSAQCKIIMRRYLAQGGNEAVKEVMNKTTELVGKAFKTKKPPSSADVKAAMQDIVFTALSKGMLDDFGSFTKKHSRNATALVPDDLVSASIAKVPNGNKIGNVVKAKIVHNVAMKNTEILTKAGFAKIAEKATGEEKENQLKKLAQMGVMSNTTTRKKVEAQLMRAFEAELKK